MSPAWYERSRMYNYVRGRQLEGSFPGAAETGMWPITSLRVHKGWGSPPEQAWPYDGYRWPPAPEPAGIDVLAKELRAFGYERLRSIDECRRVIATGYPFMAALEIDESWATAVDGRIEDHGELPTTGSHLVLFTGYDNAAGRLKFANSWGTAWGDEGFGSVSYAYFQRHWLEAWFMDLVRPGRPDQAKNGRVISLGGVHDILGRVMHVAEATDTEADEIMGWAVAVEADGLLHIDDLYVRPAYRGQGYGRELTAELRRAAARCGLPYTLWIAHVDWSGTPTPAQDGVLRALGLTVVPCQERWAAAVAIQRGRRVPSS